MESGEKFEGQFREILNTIKCFHIKYPDLKSFIRVTGKPVKGSNVPEALCDRLCIFKSHAFLFELKHREKRTFDFDGRAFRQLGRLITAEKDGGAFGFFVFDLPNGVYMVFCKTLSLYLKEHNRKSIPEDHVEAIGHHISNPEDLIRLLNKFIEN